MSEVLFDSDLVNRLDPIARAVVFDYAVAARLALVAGAAEVRAPSSPGSPVRPGTESTVVSLAALPAFADLPQALRRVAAELAFDGTFLFVEPCAAPGWRNLLRATLVAGSPTVSGLHVHRDIPAAIRAAGLCITDLERFDVPAAPRAVRWWVAGRAIHPLRASVSGVDDKTDENEEGTTT